MRNLRIIAALLVVAALSSDANAGPVIPYATSPGFANTNIDTSSELSTILTDESGSGAACFATEPVFTTSISIGAAGVKLSDDGDGAITFLGMGNGTDEDLTFNLDDTANTCTVSSSTGLATIAHPAIAHSFGSDPADSGGWLFLPNGSGNGICFEAAPANTDECMWMNTLERLEVDFPIDLTVSNFITAGGAGDIADSGFIRVQDQQFICWEGLSDVDNCVYSIQGQVTIGNGGANNGLGVDNQRLTTGTMTATTRLLANVRTVWSRYQWTNAMVVALGAATTGDITVATLPAKTNVLNALVVIDTACAGPTTLTVSAGRTGAAYIDWVVASDAKAAANTVYGDAVAERGTGLDGEFWGDLPSWTATTAVKAQFVSSGGDLNTVTTCTGSVYIQSEILQ